ncbi:hypothetical protein PSACC_01028 [Paramicrosporidium saccamoebae]|uniref:C2H2-type domain-containing protein n=1 Tax=Paramicrosporidium saccamoebae TaxID=1246581 RepID=A0A2H9TN66_9FUNG|nr:hypothetical protein PSACC_01028 [Paramicrosporidium saccamoebae]
MMTCEVIGCRLPGIDMMRSDRFLCTWPECGRTYSKISKLNEHARSHTNTRPYSCDYEGCGKTFLRNGHLQRHRLAHSAERPYSCTHCPKTFVLHHHLRRHERLHDAPAHVCSQCDTAFARKEQLRRHLRTHERRTKVYACGVDGCTEQFSKWTLVVAHRRLHSSGVVCNECGKTFGRRRNMQAHVRRVHAKIDPVGGQVCEREGCGKEFSSKNALKVHTATVHDGIKPYQCETCTKSFGHKHLLVRHCRIHSTDHEKEDLGEPAPAVLVDGLPNLVTRLTGSGVYEERHLECPFIDCRKRFQRDYDLHRHLQSFHPNMEECP